MPSHILRVPVKCYTAMVRPRHARRRVAVGDFADFAKARYRVLQTMADGPHLIEGMVLSVPDDDTGWYEPHEVFSIRVTRDRKSHPEGENDAAAVGG